MRFRFLRFASLTFAAVALTAASAAPSHAASIVTNEVWTAPPFDSVRGLARSVSREAYDEAVNDGRFETRRLTYRSDTLVVSAYLFAPKGLAERRPTVVFMRGSFRVADVMPTLLPMCRRLAEQGFVVLAPMLRGSDGMPGVDEMGGADLADLFHLIPVTAELPVTDPERLFLYGESRGGIMTFMACRAGFPAKAAATFGAITDFDSLFAHDPERMLAMARTVWQNFDRERARIVEARSAYRWASRLRVPLLLMHGADDDGVPVRQTRMMAERLASMKHPHAVEVFEGDGHAIRVHAAERDRRAAAWFTSHLPK
jgi:dipeptidyl aminopeptidase/acylaminoacyl peptidase